MQRNKKYMTQRQDTKGKSPNKGGKEGNLKDQRAESKNGNKQEEASDGLINGKRTKALFTAKDLQPCCAPY